MSRDPETTPSVRRSQKVRALLASGMIVGVGATVTLANYTDDQFARGNFGVFGTYDVDANPGVPSSPNDSSHPLSGTWSGDYVEDAPADLILTADGETELGLNEIEPGWEGYASFSLRATSESTIPGDVHLITIITDDAAHQNNQHISHQIYLMDEPGLTCDQAADGGQLVYEADGLSSQEITVDDAVLEVGEDANPGPAQRFCLTYQAGELEAGESADASWVFHTRSSTD